MNPEPFRAIDSVLLPFRSMPLPLVGLSSIILESPSSFLGGVVGASLPFGAGVPKSVEPAGAGMPVDADAPKTNGCFSAVGVDGAGVPNAKGGLAGSGAEVVDDWPNVKPEAPPNKGFGASAAGAGAEGAAADTDGWAADAPKMKGDFRGSALGLGVPNGDGCAEPVEGAPNIKPDLEAASPVADLLSAAVASAGLAGFAPNANGNGDGVVEGASIGLVVPKVNPDNADLSVFSAGDGKVNADVGVGAATRVVFLAGSVMASGDFAGAVSGVFGKTDVGLVLKPENNGC